MNEKPRRSATAAAMAAVEFNPMGRYEATMRSVYGQSIGSIYARQMGSIDPITDAFRRTGLGGFSPVLDAMKKAGGFGLSNPAERLFKSMGPMMGTYPVGLNIGGAFARQAMLGNVVTDAFKVSAQLPGLNIGGSFRGQLRLGNVVATAFNQAGGFGLSSPAERLFKSMGPMMGTYPIGLSIGISLAARHFVDSNVIHSGLAKTISDEWIARVRGLDTTTDIDKELWTFAEERVAEELDEADPLVKDLDGFLRFSWSLDSEQGQLDAKIVVTFIAVVAYICARFADLWLTNLAIDTVEFGVSVWGGTVIWSEAAKRKKQQMNREDQAD